MIWTTIILCFAIVPTVVIPAAFFIELKYLDMAYEGILWLLNYLFSLLFSIVLFACIVMPDSFDLRAIHHYEKRLAQYEQQLEAETDKYNIEYLERVKIPQMKEHIEYWHDSLYSKGDKNDKNN